MKKSTVVLLPCDTYDEEVLKEKFREGFALLGGADRFFSPEEKILLKLNLVREAAPDRAATTHPAVAAALGSVLREKGYCHLKAGDSPGFGSGVRIMEKIGMAERFARAGVEMAGFETAVSTAFPEGIHAKQFVLAKDVLDADALISVCKMKTHALEYITGGVKNQYGCVQGVNKAKGHTKYPSQESFARMLVDLNRCVKPRLFVMDGIVAMEGNGPTSGDPVPMNVLLLSDDPVAMDAVFCCLVDLDPKVVPTNVFGEQMGLGTWREENIDLLTPDGACSFAEAFRLYGNPKFSVVRKKNRGRGIMGAITLLHVFAKKPRIIPDKCKKCGVCVKSCPVEGKAISFAKGRNHPPVYNYRRCIRCFCCQEMCPHKAIEVR